MAKIPIAGPWITDKEIAYVTDAVTRCWYEDHAIYHERFERAFADYLGVRYAVTLPSCTSAIHLALAALDVGPGDEVIVPDATWIASAAPITYVGATPVFADIDRETWCLSAASFESCITPRTKAVIVVDLYGGLAAWEGIRAVAERHGVAVIEDAAEAVGADYRGTKAGALGDVGVFSFHGSKILTTGEGGMLVTDDEELFRRVCVLRDHGRDPGDRHFHNREVAYKYKMSAMQAALGLAQLERIDEIVARKREFFAWYSSALGGLEGVTLNPQPAGSNPIFWMVTVVFDARFGLHKRDVMASLDAAGIDSRPFFSPLSAIPAYEPTEQAKAARARNQVSYEICPYGVNLPSSLRLTRPQVGHVAELLKKLVNTA